MISKEIWFKSIDEQNYSIEDKSKIKNYVENLYEKDFPIIFNLEHFCLLTGIKKSVISSIVYKPFKFYYKASIPKKKGGVRNLSIPFPVLLYLQNWVKDNILIKQPAHKSATAYLPGKSILDNVKPHLHSNQILNIDLKDFFPSISLNRVIALFKYLGYNHKLSFFLASVCCESNSLPQGAPSSPFISNLILAKLDRRLYGLAEAFGISYTRYADDITFSGNFNSNAFLKNVSNIIKEEGFVINKNKTKTAFRGHKRIITGISISSNLPKLPKITKRKLRLEAHCIRKFGLKEHIFRTKKLDPLYLERIRGKLQFWKFIEPDNSFVNKAILDFKRISNSES